MNIIKATWLPLLFTFVCVVLAVKLSLFFYVPAILGFGDTIARYFDYKWIKGIVHPDLLHLKKLRYSKCQRNAAIAGYPYPNEAKLYYTSMGYKWYHLLPDGSFSLRRNCYLRLWFYKNLLGLNRSK